MKYLLRPRRMRMCAVLLVLFSAQALCAAESEAKKINVLTTIKPLYGLASVVSDGVFEPHLLITSSASPHAFQLKPSHIRSVAKADLILWAGEGVERFIPSLIKKFAPDVVQLELAELPGIVVLDSRSGDKDFSDDHRNHPIDYHLWLEPQNAVLLVSALAVKFAELDPANAEVYRDNAREFIVKLAGTVSEVEEILNPVKGQSYLVYHDSLQYFEKAFGLGEAIVVTSQPQMQAGARRLKALRVEVASAEPGCIFTEPQFRSPALKALASDLDLRSETIDPLASMFEQGPSLYTDWILHTAAAMAACLGEGAQKN